MKYSTEWTWFWILLLFHQSLVFAVDDKTLSLQSSSDFWATRGRRGGENNHSPEDLIFWANRGKRVNYNLPRPNGFLFPTTLSINPNGNILDKRKYFNLPRPNGFMFPSSIDKRGSLNPEEQEMMNAYYNHLIKKNYNLPKPNNFFFLSKNAQNPKRGDEAFKNYNLPNPNGFLWPTKQGKREDLLPWNLAKPNGFFFPTVIKNGDGQQMGKRVALEEEIAKLYNKRGEEVSGDIFFAGRGKRGNVDLDTFFAGRGRRPDPDFNDDNMDSFWALRGKKSEEEH
ncbi:uncharacterized protein [Lepeophtheirus salmonis]|uniref:uncharacterized protein n=1 Tax=Lepeophtheirus salmonis TaxID=72036 RepID=UPI001AEAC093|nr:uncharacterized protein LOC121119676 [Lepeophtheirus salmonis]